MDFITVTSFLLGLPSKTTEITKLKKSIRKKFGKLDSYYDTLERISHGVMSKYIKTRLNLHQNVSLINSLNKYLTSGDEQKCKEKIKELFKITDIELNQILDEFKNEIINSGSKELIIALQLQTVNDVHLILDEFNEFKKQQSIVFSESEFLETIDSINVFLLNNIEQGKLKYALDRIERISLDHIYGFESFKEKIIILESFIISKLGLKDRYQQQKRKLIRLPDSFKKY